MKLRYLYLIPLALSLLVVAPPAAYANSRAIRACSGAYEGNSLMTNKKNPNQTIFLNPIILKVTKSGRITGSGVASFTDLTPANLSSSMKSITVSGRITKGSKIAPFTFVCKAQLVSSDNTRIKMIFDGSQFGGIDARSATGTATQGDFLGSAQFGPQVDEL